MIKFIQQSSIIRSEKKVKDVYGYRPMDNGVYFYYHTQHDNETWELFSNTPAHDNHFIQINKTVFNIKEIMENPDRIYSLMQQELLRDSIDNLP